PAGSTGHVDTRGLVMEYHFDSNGMNDLIVNPDRSRVQMKWTDERVDSQTDEIGRTHYYVFDSDNNLQTHTIKDHGTTIAVNTYDYVTKTVGPDEHHVTVLHKTIVTAGGK